MQFITILKLIIATIIVVFLTKLNFAYTKQERVNTFDTKVNIDNKSSQQISQPNSNFMNQSVSFMKENNSNSDYSSYDENRSVNSGDIKNMRYRQREQKEIFIIYSQLNQEEEHENFDN